MRSGTQNAELVIEDGEFVGINLGWDFTAEHEWGIKYLVRDFGIRGVSRKKGFFTKHDVTGVYARAITKVSEYLVLLEKDDATYLIYQDWFSPKYALTDETPKDELDRIVYAYGDHKLQTAWDSKSFGVRVIGDELRNQLKELYAAFQNKDIMIAMGGRQAFGNAGLNLIIASKLPESFDKELIEADVDGLNMIDAAEATGIKKRLENAGRRHYALSPSWATSIKSTKDGEIKTKHSVIFWLNPMDQHLYNFGWLTVEDLEDWIEGKGKIVKDSA